MSAKLQLIRHLLDQARAVEEQEEGQVGVYIGGGAILVIVVILLLILLL